MIKAPIIQASGLQKSYQQGTSELPILRGINLQIRTGEALCIVGPSGAGKSTLLHILGTLDSPNQGELLFEGRDLFKMSDDELSLFRNKTMGFVFQFHHLLPELTALENVLLPCRIANEDLSGARQTAMDLLKRLGLEARAHHLPKQLSGGELQRVAIARALVRKPKVLFADEPTGNLDSQNSLMIQNLFFQLKESLGLTLIVVTHDPNFARRFSRVLRITDGQWSHGL